MNRPQSMHKEKPKAPKQKEVDEFNYEKLGGWEDPLVDKIERNLE